MGAIHETLGNFPLKNLLQEVNHFWALSAGTPQSNSVSQEGDTDFLFADHKRNGKVLKKGFTFTVESQQKTVIFVHKPYIFLKT